MRNVTAEEVEKSAHEHGLRFVKVRTCSICDAPIGYVFDDEAVYWDGSCNCLSRYTPPEPRTFQDVANLINMQNEEWKPKMAALFGVKHLGAST
jgi:hypothetical protein